MIFKLIIPIVFGSCFCDAKSYENFTLYRGIPVEERQLEFLRNLSSVYDVDFWRMPGSLRMPVEFVIAPDDKDSFLKEANKIGVSLNTIMSDVQSAFDKQTVKPYTRKHMDTFDWHNFYKTKDIYNWLYDLARAFPHEVQVLTIGKTHENRDILAVKVVLRGCKVRSKVMIEGGIHAREWISPAFVTYMLHRIVYSAISPDRELRTIAMTYEWYFVPVLNPDGYDYTFHKNVRNLGYSYKQRWACNRQVDDRLWRKNRNGKGVDLNRNFGYGFGTEGVSFDKDSSIYCGEKAFSEKETIAMGRFIKSKHANLEYYISFHSYGQYIIIPYAQSTKHVENYAEVREMGLRTAEKIKTYYRKKYSVGTAYDTVGYTVSGASICWAKKSFGIPYSMTFELRDQGSYGFALPPAYIIPTCEETLGGLLTMLKPRAKLFMDVKHGADLVVDSGQARYLNQIVMVFTVMLLITV